MNAASIAWRLGLATLLFTASWQVWQLRRAPAWMEAQIDRQARETRKDLDTRLDRLIDISQASMQDIAQRADARLQDLAERVDRQLTTANGTVSRAAEASTGEVAKMHSDVEPLLEPIRNTLGVLSENADLLGRCATQDPATGEWIGNPDCLANRVIPAMKSMERMANAGEHMAQTIEKETPATAAAVRSTSESAARIADHFAHPVSWIKGVLMTGVRAAGKWFGF